LTWSVAAKFIRSADTMSLTEEDLGWGVRSKINVVNQWVNIIHFPINSPVCVFLSPPSLVKDYIRSVEWMFSFQTVKTSLHVIRVKFQVLLDVPLFHIKAAS
jgi:hypothetical protein